MSLIVSSDTLSIYVTVNLQIIPLVRALTTDCSVATFFQGKRKVLGMPLVLRLLFAALAACFYPTACWSADPG